MTARQEWEVVENPVATNRILMKEDNRDEWVVSREKTNEIYRFESKRAAQNFALALARQRRPCTVAVLVKGELESEFVVNS